MYATPYYATPNSEMFMPPFFLHPWIFLCLEEKIEIHQGISTFLAHFFSQPSFFYAIHFHATLKKIELFIPPSKILCHPFYEGGGIRKTNGPLSPEGDHFHLSIGLQQLATPNNLL